MEEKTLLQVRINRNTNQYVVEAPNQFRSHMATIQETLDFVAGILTDYPFTRVIITDSRDHLCDSLIEVLKDHHPIDNVETQDYSEAMSGYEAFYSSFKFVLRKFGIIKGDDPDGW